MTGRDVREMSGVVPDKWISGMVDVCKKNSFEKMQAYVDEFMAEGYSVVQFIDQLHSRVVDDEQARIDFVEWVKGQYAMGV